MAEILKWKVIRSHDGDRWYSEGETRQGTKADLGHLSPQTLELIGPAGKAEPTLLNKAEPAPANKALTGRKTK